MVVQNGGYRVSGTDQLSLLRVIRPGPAWPPGSSDTRVIISAYRIEKLAMITRVSSVIRPEGV